MAMAQLLIFAVVASATRIDHGHLRSDSKPSQPRMPLFFTEQDAGAYPQTDRIEQCLLANPSTYPTPQRHQYNTCAVVGRAPNTAGSLAADRIEGHDAVFRAGLCGSEVGAAGLRQDIGIRTDYCVAFWVKHGSKLILPLKSWKWLYQYHPSPSCHAQFWFTHPEWLKWLDNQLTLLAQQSPPPQMSVEEWRASSIFYDPTCSLKGKTEVYDQCRQVVNLSSGFLAVALAMELCKSVDLYGFDLDTSLDAVYGHVNGSSANGRHKVGEHPHAFPLERHLLKLYEARGRLHFDKSMTSPPESRRVPPSRWAMVNATRNRTEYDTESVYAIPW